jgi:UDP-GlcNAc:undecaprenyl-phosphate GlcNAc-1-phosphate transferase
MVVTSLGVALLLPLLKRKEILDLPNERSSHRVPVPRGGGIAVVAGLLAAGGLASAVDMAVPFPIVTVIVMLAAVGWLDDLRNQGGMVRLSAQIVCGTVIAVWLLNVSKPAGWPPYLFALVAVVAFAAYVNAFNFMDGINGISSLSTMLAGGWYAWLGYENNISSLWVLGLAASGAAIGFLPWNAPRARIFLGDVGSYALGGLIVALALLAWAHGMTVLDSCAPLLIYLADTGWALVKRMVRRKPLTEAHREHVYQRLVDGGWGHASTALVVAVATISICGAAYFAGSATAMLAWATVTPLLIAYLSLPALTGDRARLGAGR